MLLQKLIILFPRTHTDIIFCQQFCFSSKINEFCITRFGIFIVTCGCFYNSLCNQEQKRKICLFKHHVFFSCCGMKWLSFFSTKLQGHFLIYFSIILFIKSSIIFLFFHLEMASPQISLLSLVRFYFFLYQYM